MTLTKKDFIAIAGIIASMKSDEHTDPNTGILSPHESSKRHTLNAIAQRLADYCETQNANFQRSRFLDACGVNP